MEHHAVHPVHAWLAKHGHDEAWLAAELKQRGLEYEISYIKQVVTDGYYPPGRKLQNALCAISGVPIAKIAGYAYRSERATG